MLTGWLPVFHQVNKMTNGKQMCPLCQNDETINHMYQCQHRQQWRNKFEHELHKQLILINTPIPLQDEISHHLHQILHDNVQYTHFSHFTLFAGLIPRQWSIQHQNNTDLQSSLQWAMKISKWFTTKGYELWTTRNNQLHNEDSPSPLHQQLNHQIDQLYQLQDEVSPTDRDIFNIPQEERYKLPEIQKKMWIEETRHTIQLSIAEQQEKMSTGQTDIRQFLIQKGKPQ